jgi:hypothetical protein
MSSSGERNGRALIGIAVVASLVLVGVYLAAGGASYAPAKTQDPCKDRPWRNPEGLEQIAEQFTLSALDGAACQLGVSREELAQALASDEAREKFAERYEISEAEIAKAIRSGLLRAVNDAERAGALSPVVADPIRETIRSIPLDQAIELLQNSRSLLNGAEGLLGPAQGLLEQFLP